MRTFQASQNRTAMGSSTVFMFAFFALIVGVQSCALKFKDCGSMSGKVLSVNFNGTCTAEKQAILKKKSYVQLQISLDSYEATTKLTSVVHGIIAGIPVKFPLGNPDACSGCNVTCPVQKGKHYNYAPVIHVLDSYPSIRLVVKWELQDDNSNDLICVEMAVIIISG